MYIITRSCMCISFLQTVLVGLARAVCMLNYVPHEKTRPAFDMSGTTKLEDTKARKDIKRMRIRELKHNRFLMTEVPIGVHHCTCQTNGTINGMPNGVNAASVSPDASPLHLTQGLEADIREIKRYIRSLIYKQKHEANIERIRGEWRAVALVLDRFFFFLYLISIIVSLGSTFPRQA